MTGASAPVIHAASSDHVRVIPDPIHLNVDMDMTGRQRYVTRSLQRILIVEIRLVCMDPKSVLL